MNVAIMIQIGVAMPKSFPKPMPSRNGDVMYVVWVSDQMLTIPRCRRDSVPSVTTKNERPALPISTPFTPPPMTPAIRHGQDHRKPRRQAQVVEERREDDPGEGE